MSSIAQYNLDMNNPFAPVPISAETVKAMKVAVQDLNLDHRPSTVSALATALAGNRKVLNAQARSANKTVLDVLTKQLRKITFRNRAPKSDDEEMKRRYEFLRAVNRLETRPHASEELVLNWEMAEQALKSILVFPEDQVAEEEGEVAAIEALPSAAEIASQHQKDMEDLFRAQEEDDVKPYSEMWRKVAAVPIPTKLGGDDKQKEAIQKQKSAMDKADNMFRLRLDSETAEIEERLRKKELKEIEDAIRAQELEEEARERASSLMRPLSDDERDRVHEAIHGHQPSSAILAKCESDSVQQQSMWTLQPGQWVNDEIIHYFLLMLVKRDEELCITDPSRKRCHFFKSFFITKLLNEGHATMDGQYEYRNVKRWSKKVPGKDLSKLDKVFFPINQGNMHWLCACAFIQEKRIEVYDSMGSGGRKYLNAIFQYLQDDYKDKKGSSMPDIDDWQLVGTRGDTPMQRNGYDCGVFTCMFIDFLSKDCPLVFSQDHINQCRERIALSILNGKAIM